MDFNLSAAKLMKSHLYLCKDSDCLLLAGAADMLIPFGNGNIIGKLKKMFFHIIYFFIYLLGPGPFIKMLESSAQRKAKIFGKPGQELADLLKMQTKQANRVLFIGDSMESDIKFGKSCGFQTMIVLSGGTKQEDLNNYAKCNEVADYVAYSMADFNEII